MIRSSFIMLPGIGAEREKRLWQSGIWDWSDFRQSAISGIGFQRKKKLDAQLTEAGHALNDSDSSFFRSIIPSSQAWRLYSSFKHEAIYLDIETTGLSCMAKTTVVGLYDGEKSKTLVRGTNLDRETLKRALTGCKLIVTFNGASFDLPFLMREFPGALPMVPHIDLRPVCAAAGLTGGLKRIEKNLGIIRREQIGDLHGGDAVTLWRMYNATGDRHYLNLLLEYNEEDTVNLERVATSVISSIENDFKERYFRR